MDYDTEEEGDKTQKKKRKRYEGMAVGKSFHCALLFGRWLQEKPYEKMDNLMLLILASILALCVYHT